MPGAASSCATIRLPLPPPVEEQARLRLTKYCPFAFYFRQIKFEFAGGVLTLRGRVLTFYLKQILQTWLQGLDNVKKIDNRVDVVNAAGLSSEPSAEPVEPPRGSDM
jgi:hypothetical protein